MGSIFLWKILIISHLNAAKEVLARYWESAALPTITKWLIKVLEIVVEMANWPIPFVEGKQDAYIGEKNVH